jgi:hypothetical protein
MKTPTLQPLTEREFTAQVLGLARLCGWRSAHFRPGRTVTGWKTAVQGDARGFPDLLLLKGDVLIAAELKVGNNRLSPQQAAWLAAFRAAGVAAYLWYPRDWPEIEQVIAGDGPQNSYGVACGTRAGQGESKVHPTEFDTEKRVGGTKWWWVSIVANPDFPWDFEGRPAQKPREFGTWQHC